ncbi:MAG TPA: phytanoyl-CoA dioxygenase family protein [Pyrinomonadaceae bacterium]|jgi:ectoine hydroxylase-related dioxygenase (phytanoyl-CoA dioxygenase family)
MIRDLSNTHHPVTDLFPSPRSAEEWNDFRLKPEQVDFYRENGYLAGVRMLGDRQVETLRQELDQLTDPTNAGRDLFYEYNSNESADPSTRLFHALGAWRVTPGFHDVLWNPAFLVAASQLLDGSAVRFWHDQIFSKPARHGGVVAWHQDYSYWTRTRPMAHLSCWIGLDDVSIDNGCVHYVPGSHRWNLLPITGLANNMDSIQTVLTEKQRREFRPAPIELEAGEASFHHPLMVHGSFENRTDRPRRALVINVFADGVESASNAPPLEGVPVIQVGCKMEGQFFPLLFDPGLMSDTL